jgi:predicted regulator of Ras-like GTPase activity (Roadblock/LC7/MglB family)
MRAQVAESWVEIPLQRFVSDTRVLFALLLHPSGQVLGQYGFTRAVDVMAACALAAAIHASAAQLGRELDGRPFRELYHEGPQRQIFLAEANAGGGSFVFLAAFDGESSLGLVQLYFREFCARLGDAAPAAARPTPVLAASFERDLDRNLAALFGRARPRDGSTDMHPSA